MKLSSLQLEAFAATAKTLNFSKAAKQLHITQSALSQRIQKLEERLEHVLFLRETRGIKLTTMGERLLHYCTSQAALEQEFLMHTALSDYHKLVGSIRIAGFSTIMESLVLPELSVLLKEHPQLGLELHSLEIRELVPALESGVVDFIITSSEIQRPSIRYDLLGYEANVLIKSALTTCPEDVFLDHDSDDTITSNFWRQQNKSLATWRTFYLDNIHMILAGVKQGLGRAVVPLHLVQNDVSFSIIDEFTSLKTPVYLACFKGDAQTKLQKVLCQRITRLATHLSN